MGLQSTNYWAKNKAEFGSGSKQDEDHLMSESVSAWESANYSRQRFPEGSWVRGSCLSVFIRFSFSLELTGRDILGMFLLHPL